MTNRLAGETSPYLLQHKDNPVDWYPWGEEALERARSEDKPIVLSVGYAACHWCHVMEHESFEDEQTAELMNSNFISIKVDREERPDIDSIYMDAVQAMTGHGGWPMTVFLTPDGRPFYGGTYFPPEDRHGMPSFKRLLVAIAETWRERRDDAEEQGRRLLEALDPLARMEPSKEVIEADLLDRAYERMATDFDPEYGGFGGAPKFPQPMTLDFLMRMAERGHDRAAQMVKITLDAMARGGIFDQLGGGFHRYSVDRRWIVPHFEKMLYDNAQLLRTYARSWQRTRDPLHEAVARATAKWMLREMRDPAGGFWSSLDADSDGEEGKFYVWSFDDVRGIASNDAETAVARWGISENGNFEGRNIPTLESDDVDLDAVARAQLVLLRERDDRVRPATDTKVLTAWNALAASALAEAGAALDATEWIEAAAEAMQFALKELRVAGRVMRSYRDGVTRQPGFSEDYAYSLEACLTLYETTFHPEWLREARWMADEAIRLFADGDRGGFFTTGTDTEELITRAKDLIDNAMPSANSVFAVELQRLALITGDRRYEERALGILELLRSAVAQSPLGFAHVLNAVDFYVSTASEIVIVGELDAADTRSLVETVRSRFIPNRVLIVSSPPEGAETPLPLLRDRAKLDGKATAYVCRNGTCKLPVSSSEDLTAQLAQR